MPRVPHHQLPEEEELDWEEELIEEYQDRRGRKKTLPRRTREQDYDDYDQQSRRRRNRD